MLHRTRLFAAVSVFSGALSLGSGCDGCGRRGASREGAREREAVAREPAPERSCAAAADCQDQDPCTRNDCVDERCVVSLAPRGTVCGDESPCDGVASCDQNGRCVPGTPPAVDDGNSCTIDSCDPKRGLVHEPVPVDDFDACTTDSCDPGTGQIAHTTLAIDDGNDCTKDSCDPRAGVKHEQPNGTYTCQAGCNEGFHVASRTPSPECGSPEALRSFCAPNCGASFYTCDGGCPTGYQKRVASPGGSCGTKPSIMLFCVKA